MRIVMLLHKSVEHDSRVRREATALAQAGHTVSVVHLPRRTGEVRVEGCEVVSAAPPAWVRRRLPFHLYRLVFLAAFVAKVRALRPDVIHAHDAAMLAPGLAGARLTGAKLVYDSHEYAAGVPYRERAWALFVTTLERMLIRRCSAVITVSDGIADRLMERYRLAQRPVVVRNTPDVATYKVAGTAVGLRDQLKLDGPLVLHLGAVARDRGCTTLIRALGCLDGSTQLVFVGADDESFANELLRLAASRGIRERVHILKSVPIVDLLAYTAQADVGISLLEDTCDNHRLALPNKVFEYLAAGLPVVASDLPELRRTLTGVPGTVLVSPTDAQAVGTAIQRAIAMPRPSASTGLPLDFRWPVDAQRLVSLYDEIERRREVHRSRQPTEREDA